MKKSNFCYKQKYVIVYSLKNISNIYGYALINQDNQLLLKHKLDQDILINEFKIISLIELLSLIKQYQIKPDKYWQIILPSIKFLFSHNTQSQNIFANNLQAEEMML